MEHKEFPAVVTDIDADQGIVKAIFAVMGNVDSGGDMIHPGAFTKTFSERGGQIMVLDNHRVDSVMSILGKPLGLRELGRNSLPVPLIDAYPDANGAAEAEIQFLLDTPEGKGAFARIKDGALSRWSFGYDPLDHDYSKVKGDDGVEQTVRNLRTIKLYELSPVLFAMNEATMTTDVKAQQKAAVMKTETDGKHPASHYLVVEDAEAVTTWHLRVRGADGDLDHGLMGAAWAALHGGYRGNVYEGPEKAAALTKLQGLYTSEGMETPKALVLLIDGDEQELAEEQKQAITDIIDTAPDTEQAAIESNADKQAGPDAEPPTSSTLTADDIMQQLIEIQLLEVENGLARKAR